MWKGFPPELSGELIMTKEQYLEKLDSLNSKYETIELQYSKKLKKIEADYQKNLTKVPYTKNGVSGTFTVTKEWLDNMHAFDLELAKTNYEESLLRNKENIKKVEKQLDKLLEKEQNLFSIKEMRTPIPELVSSIKDIVHHWVENEQNLPEDRRYYSLLDEDHLMNLVVLPIAENITFRCFTKIGKIKSFSRIHFVHGEVDMFASNDNGDSCHLYSTVVCGHLRTNYNGKTFEVRPHIRTIVK